MTINLNNSITDNIIEIAEQLDCGFRAFIHKQTMQQLFIPDENNFFDMDFAPWNEELEQLEHNSVEFYEIEKWSSRESFNMMSEFSEQVSDYLLKSKLFEALSKNKPFKEFKFIIDNSGDYRQQWFDFKNNKQ